MATKYEWEAFFGDRKRIGEAWLAFWEDYENPDWDSASCWSWEGHVEEDDRERWSSLSIAEKVDLVTAAEIAYDGMCNSMGWDL